MNRLVILVAQIICQTGNISVDTLINSQLHEISKVRDFAICFLFESKVPLTDLSLFFKRSHQQINVAILATHMTMAMGGKVAHQYAVLSQKMAEKIKEFWEAQCNS